MAELHVVQYELQMHSRDLETGSHCSNIYCLSHKNNCVCKITSRIQFLGVSGRCDYVVFLYSWFNDADNSSDYTASKDKMISG
jgi:hypothetical protein